MKLKLRCLISYLGGKDINSFYSQDLQIANMALKLRCVDYGFECDFVIEDQLDGTQLTKLRNHFEEEHGIDYSKEAVTQMIMNKGHSLESIGK